MFRKKSPKQEIPADEEVMKSKGWFGRQLDVVARKAIRTGFKTVYRTEVKGLENFKGLEGKPVLIVANHVSGLDGVLLAGILPSEAAFAYKKESYEAARKSKWRRFLLKRINTFPVDMNSPWAIKDLTRLAQSGRPVVIFPEGRTTNTGTLMQIFDGAASVAERSDAIIVPVYIEGMEAAPMTDLTDHPKHRFPKLTVTVMKPTQLDIPEGVSGKEARALQHRQLESIMHNLPIAALDKNKTLMDALHEATENFGWKYPILEDLERKMTYGEVLTAAYALGGALNKMTKEEKNVGVLLPNSCGGSVTFWALAAYGRVPAILNPRAESADMLSYTETASLKTIVTSRRFVELAGLQDRIEALSKTCKIVYLEDVRKKIGPAAKAKALLRAKGRLGRPKEQSKKGNDPAVILFTSGSEAAPKGVVLSSTNLISNVTQVSTVVPYSPKDKVFNAMPIFHSFGLCGGLIMPMLKGMNSFQYPTPLDGKIIPKLVYSKDSTIMFGTNTFLNLYARNATNDDLKSLKHVFAGAEALTEETYNTYFRRFGIQVNQGYGMTEASPAVSINVRGAHEADSVGKFLPGIETRLEPVPDIADGYRLYIKGPNVMLGYLKNDKPGVIQPPEGGWHDTGDIVSVSKEGFVKLVGRAKRFAKIGGEMVSLDAVETVARAASVKPNAEHAVVLRQDAAKGDSIVLFTTDAALKREQLVEAAQAAGRSILGLPKNPDIHVVESLPKLPTGKTDYVTLKKMLQTPVANDNNAAADFNQAGTAPEQKKAPKSPTKQASQLPKKRAPGP